MKKAMMDGLLSLHKISQTDRTMDKDLTSRFGPQTPPRVICDGRAKSISLNTAE